VEDCSGEGEGRIPGLAGVGVGEVRVSNVEGGRGEKEDQGAYEEYEDYEEGEGLGGSEAG